MSAVELININKLYNNKAIISKMNLKIKDGEFMVMLGRSGCGKSTLLRMIAGLERVTSGLIKIGGDIVNDLPPKMRNVAMVFQNYALYPHMTAYENMAFPLKYGTSITKKEIKERVMDAAGILNLEDQLDKKPQALSGGQKQRVAVGRAIVRKPSIFLFDEPLSNLDADLRAKMRFELVQLHKKLGTTVIYVTHDQVEAMTMGERICIINDGVVRQIDHPSVVYEKPADEFVATFVGTPKMNILECLVVFEEKNLFLEVEKMRFQIDNKLITKTGSSINKVKHKIKIGIRPEHIYLEPADKQVSSINAGDSIQFTCTVSAMEVMGHETIIYLKWYSHQLIMREMDSCKRKPGDVVAVTVSKTKIHFFC